MLRTYARSIPITVWIGLMMATWVLLVPGQLSVASSDWLNLGVGCLALSVLQALERLRPKPIMAQILYEVEHQPKA